MTSGANKTIWLIDTSVLNILLNIPCTDGDKVRPELLNSLRSKIKNGGQFLLPFTTILEVGNNIAGEEAHGFDRYLTGLKLILLILIFERANAIDQPLDDELIIAILEKHNKTIIKSIFEKVTLSQNEAQNDGFIPQNLLGRIDPVDDWFLSNFPRYASQKIGVGDMCILRELHALQTDSRYRRRNIEIWTRDGNLSSEWQSIKGNPEPFKS